MNIFNSVLNKIKLNSGGLGGERQGSGDWQTAQPKCAHPPADYAAIMPFICGPGPVIYKKDDGVANNDALLNWLWLKL